MTLPAMSVHVYLVRIRRFTKFDLLCFLIAVWYIGEIARKGGPRFCPTPHNVHRLLITGILLASKANDGAQPARSPPAL